MGRFGAGITLIAYFAIEWFYPVLFELMLSGATLPFVEVHVATPIEVCESRDPKGLYARARAGELKGLTGVDAPYEAPENPDLVLDTAGADIDELVGRVLEVLNARRGGS